MASRPEHWMDNSAGYGYVSRFLHWSMALLFTWQFASALLRVFADETPVQVFFWRTHHSIGFSLFVLVLLRGAWGLINARRRPAHAQSLLGRAAFAGHIALYALMVAVPLLAIVRAYGRGRGFPPFGVPLFTPTGVEIPALTAPANALHGLLGWTLLALVAGHIAMVLIHRYLWRDDTLSRMKRG